MSDESCTEPDDEAGDDDHGPEVRGSFLIAGRDTAELLEPADTALHDIAPSVRGCIEAATMLIRPGRDRESNAASAQDLPAGWVTVALVGQDPRRTGSWSSASDLRYPDAVKDRLELGALVPVTARQHEGERPTLAITRQMQLRRYSASAASERFIRRMLDPLFSSA